MNLEYENLVPSERNKQVPKRKKNTKKPKKSSVLQNKPQPIIKANTELQKVYTILDVKIDSSRRVKLIFSFLI